LAHSHSVGGDGVGKEKKKKRCVAMVKDFAAREMGKKGEDMGPGCRQNPMEGKEESTTIRRKRLVPVLSQHETWRANRRGSTIKLKRQIRHNRRTMVESKDPAVASGDSRKVGEGANHRLPGLIS